MVRNGVADRFLACGVLDHGFARIRSDDGTPPKRLRADCLHRRRLLGGIARVAPRTVTAARHRPRAPTRADRGQSPLGEGPTVALLQQIFEVDPLACPCCYGAMGIVAFITQTSVIDQILTHLRSRASRGARAGAGIPPSNAGPPEPRHVTRRAPVHKRHAAARQEALARSAITLYARWRVDPPRLKVLSRSTCT